MENVEKQNSELDVKKDFRPILIYLLGQIIVPIVIGMIMGAIVGIDKINQKQLAGYATIGAFTFIFISFIILYFKKIKEDIKKLTKKNVLLIVIVSIFILLINHGICLIFEKLNVSMDNQESISEILENFKFLMSIVTAFFAPIIEEIVFRYSLSTIIKNKVAFVIISSILFGLIHGIGIATLLYIIIGIGFALIYLKTNKNIISSMIAHIINNIVAVIPVVL